MSVQPGERIFGVETEFGCLVEEDLTPDMAVELIKDAAFDDMKMGLLDLHARDEVFEPAQSGGFLINGGRLYVDAVGDHLEYATAECRTLKDLIAHDRAGRRLIVQAVQKAGLQDQVRFYANSVDHFGGHTFGCHENYLVEMSEDFFSAKAPLLYPFLISRQIFAGVGRVGGHVLVGGAGPSYQDMMENPIDYVWVSQVYSAIPDNSVRFQLSQRADHILKTIAGRVRFNRALINPKWEHFYAHEGKQRLHVLFGEANQSQYAYALKIGTTHLVLRLVEEGKLNRSLQLMNPVLALRQISRDESYQWRVQLSSGEMISAIDIQREHLELCQEYRGESEDVDWILREWESVLEGLEKDPLSLDDRLDWVAKRKLVDMYRESEGLEWDDDALHSIDMEYHRIDPVGSLFDAWQEERKGPTLASEIDILDAMTIPPQNTRAKARGSKIQELLMNRSMAYAIDWSGIASGSGEVAEYPDPFDTYD